MERLVMHVDMDAFFASVEQLDHPEWRGRPVIVGGLNGRGVVSTCSYEARRFGVHSAMPMFRAQRLCPQGIFVPGDYRRYAEVSGQIFAIFARYSPVVEPLSIDEAFLDLTGMERLMQSPREYAERLKRDILAETGIVASVGIAPNKFLAKIASDLEKPNGLVVVERERVQAVLDPLPVGTIWGVGKKLGADLHLMGIDTIGELRAASPTRLKVKLGERLATHLSMLARGLDDRPVAPRERAKSIGKEVTFTEDINSAVDAERALLDLASRVGWRLRKAGEHARTIQLKLRLSYNFQTYTRSRTLAEATCYDEDIYHAARELYRATHITRGIRLLGIAASGFEGGEISLFSDTARKEKLYAAIDGIKARFGEGGITKANLISAPAPPAEGGLAAELKDITKAPKK